VIFYPLFASFQISMSKFCCPPLPMPVPLIHLHFDFVHVVHSVVFLCFILTNWCRIHLGINLMYISSRLLMPVGWSPGSPVGHRLLVCLMTRAGLGRSLRPFLCRQLFLTGDFDHRMGKESMRA